MNWKKLSSKTMYQNRFMTVTEDELVTPSGEKVTYGVVHKKPFAIVIPWENSKTVLVGQYRYSVDYFSWEFPSGHYEESHKSIKDAANAELKEETGLTAKNITEIGSFFLATGHHTQKGHIFVATDLARGERELEASEKDMEMKWVTLDEMKNMIKDGTIKDSPTITTLKYFELYLESES